MSNTGTVLKEASKVASGDIYIVTGQSNSVINSNPPPTDNNYIRTFASPNNYTTNLVVIVVNLFLFFREMIPINMILPLIMAYY